MNLLEIILIIIGIIVVIISCVLVDHNQKKDQGSERIIPVQGSITEEDKKYLMKKVEEILSESREETIIRTDDALSKISNEKIMAVSEFSDQILKKIKHNHEEVVFLYNMLNDKEKELKAAVREIDSSRRMVQSMMEGKAEQEKVQTAKHTSSRGVAKSKTQAAQLAKKDKVGSNPNVESENTSETPNPIDHKDRILELNAQGMTVLDISRQLGLGQGEVKLVIDLYRGKK